MAFYPLYDRVLVRRIEEEITKGGIVIPDKAKEKPIQGKIVAVGEGKLLNSGEIRPLKVKVGDTILFGKYSGTDVEFDREGFVVMREEDILGIIE
jgi:chaperonin GroES